MKHLRQDIRYALRSWKRQPGFVAITILVLGCGIGMAVTVFSLFDAVLLHSLPFRHSERVVLLWQQDLSSGRDRITLSPREYSEYSMQSHAFESLGAVRGITLTTGTGEASAFVDGVQVTRSLFDTMGVSPVLGRAFAFDEDTPGNDHVALLTYEFWQRGFGGDWNVVGRKLKLRAGFTGRSAPAADIDGDYVVVGVLPPRTNLPYRSADVWIPLPQRIEDASSTRGLIVFGRLKPNVSLAAATDDVVAIAGRLAEQFPEQNRGLTGWLVTLRTEDSGDIEPTLLLLVVTVALLALLICANIGNMLLGSLAERQRELTVRWALGASQKRIVQQLLTEGALLASGGAAVGILLAIWSTRILAARAPSSIPRVNDIRIDLAALLIALTTAGVMTILFALAPAIKVSRDSMASQLGQRSGNAARSGRLRDALVVAEIGLAFVVLVGAGLVVSSAVALEGARIGYDPHNVLTFRTSLPYARYASPVQRQAFYSEVLDRLRSLPGVTAAGAVSILPQMDTNANVQFELDDRAREAAGDAFNVRFRVATTGYFTSLRMPILEGRDFRDADLVPGAIIISRSMRDRYWPKSDPVGHQVHLVSFSADSHWLPIVGVVEDVRQWIVTPVQPTIYLLNASQPAYAIAVRTSGEPLAAVNAARESVRQVDSEQPIFDVRTQEDRLTRSQQFAYERFRTGVMVVFGLATLVLAAFGIYGVVRYAVARRTQEFGIRLALGATPGRVIWMVFTQALRSLAIGTGVGLTLSFVLARLMASVLYGAVGMEPLIVILVVLVLGGTTIAAALGPARHAGRVDPLVALRMD